MQRQELAQIYSNLLDGFGDIILPRIAAKCTHVYHLYVIRTQRRNELQKHLFSKGIDTLIHYPIPIHLQQAYTGLKMKMGDYPIAEEISSTALSLPIYPGLTIDQINYICLSIREFFINNKKDF
jgi:dTDP-4-amino-4,6-dideoxygalactose transaminase